MKNIFAPLLEKLRKIGIPKDKRLTLTLAAAALAVLAILLSELWNSKEALPPEVSAVSSAPPLGEQYAQDMEKRLSETLACIQGVGRVAVMITLENGPEQLYAQDERHQLTASETGESAQDDYSYLLVRTADGAQSGLLVKIIQPQIRGVAVICDGGGSAAIRQEITDVVTAVLDISTLRVSVSAMKP